MLNLMTRKLSVTEGQKAYISAYIVVACLGAVATLALLLTLQAPYGLASLSSAAIGLRALAGALAALIALYLVRGWMGGAGVRGLFRAAVGAAAVALVTAIIAGTLIAPFEGTIYAPLLLLTAMVAAPWAAVFWFAIMAAVHLLISYLHEEEVRGVSRTDYKPITQELSTLSRMHLYRQYY